MSEISPALPYTPPTSPLPYVSTSTNEAKVSAADENQPNVSELKTRLGLAGGNVDVPHREDTLAKFQYCMAKRISTCRLSCWKTTAICRKSSVINFTSWLDWYIVINTIITTHKSAFMLSIKNIISIWKKALKSNLEELCQIILPPVLG